MRGQGRAEPAPPAAAAGLPRKALHHQYRYFFANEIICVTLPLFRFADKTFQAMAKLFQALNLTGFVLMVSTNYLAVSLPLNGQTPGEISDRYPTLFTPAGFTFAIWSVIYVFLLVFSVAQSRGLFRRQAAAPAVVRRIGPWFFLNAVTNAAWLFAWHFEQIGLAMAIMVAILATLVQIYTRTGIGHIRFSRREQWTVQLPFSIYLGWISVATIANAAVLLVDAGWTGGGLPPAVWTAALLLTAMALGTWFLYRNGDVAYAMVLTWALFGIRTARQQDLPPQELVSWVALGGIVVLIFLSLYLVLSGKERLAD
jgi:hypothetical protein